MSKACCASAWLETKPDRITPSSRCPRRGRRNSAHLLDRSADAVEIARHRDIEAGQLLAFGVEEEDVGLADLVADHVSAARRADHGIGDLRLATRTSLMSRGKSITSDLPTPSATEREPKSLAATAIWRCGSPYQFRRDRAAVRQRRNQRRDARADASSRRTDRCPWSHLEVPPRAHCAADWALTPKRTVLIVRDCCCSCGGSPPSGVGDWESSRLRSVKEMRAELTRKRQRFGLLRIKLDGDGLADRRLLPFLVLNRLVDREHPHVPQDRFADVLLDAGDLLRPLVAAREDDVDMVVRQDEAAGVAFRRYVDRDRAHARAAGPRP